RLGSGTYMIGVSHAAGARHGPEASYTLEVTGGFGKPVGVGAVTTRFVNPGPGDAIPRNGLSPLRVQPRGVETSAYPNSVLEIPPDAIPRRQQVTFGPVFDAYACDKFLTASLAWQSRNGMRHNRTPVFVQFGDFLYSEGIE